MSCSSNVINLRVVGIGLLRKLDVKRKLKMASRFTLSEVEDMLESDSESEEEGGEEVYSYLDRGVSSLGDLRALQEAVNSSSEGEEECIASPDDFLPSVDFWDSLSPSPSVREMEVQGLGEKIQLFVKLAGIALH